jgi:hypothetical protein
LVLLERLILYVMDMWCGSFTKTLHTLLSRNIYDLNALIELCKTHVELATRRTVLFSGNVEGIRDVVFSSTLDNVLLLTQLVHWYRFAIPRVILFQYAKQWNSIMVGMFVIDGSWCSREFWWPLVLHTTTIAVSVTDRMVFVMAE